MVTALAAIPGCETTTEGRTYVEFPITDPVFAGGETGSAGLDRVLGATTGRGTLEEPWGAITYCLSMTHRGQGAGGAVIPCV